MASIESETSSFKPPIRQLTDDNYPEWLIDIKAHLRSKKLWEYTQSDEIQKNRHRYKQNENIQLWRWPML